MQLGLWVWLLRSLYSQCTDQCCFYNTCNNILYTHEVYRFLHFSMHNREAMHKRKRNTLVQKLLVVLSFAVISLRLSPVTGDHLSFPTSWLPAQIGTDASSHNIPPGTVHRPPDNARLLLQEARWLWRATPSTQDSTAPHCYTSSLPCAGPPDWVHLPNRFPVESKAEGGTGGGGDYEGYKQNPARKHSSCSRCRTLPG